MWYLPGFIGVGRVRPCGIYLVLGRGLPEWYLPGFLGVVCPSGISLALVCPSIIPILGFFGVVRPCGIYMALWAWDMSARVVFTWLYGRVTWSVRVVYPRFYGRG